MKRGIWGILCENGGQKGKLNSGRHPVSVSILQSVCLVHTTGHVMRCVPAVFVWSDAVQQRRVLVKSPQPGNANVIFDYQSTPKVTFAFPGLRAAC